MNSFINKISPELLKTVNILNTEKIDCIVYSSNYKLLKQTISKKFSTYFEYPFINALGIKLTMPDIYFCAKTSEVSFISKQTKVSAQIDLSKKILNVDSFYNNNVYGENCTIAIIDTGINPHLDFVIPKNRIIKFVDLINNKTHPYDDNGHGTFVASIACGSGLKSNFKYSGIAPKSNIVAIKALEKTGESGAYKVLEAMQWVFDNHKKYNIKVVCMSFGSSPTDKLDPLVKGAEALWNDGVIVVAAAGNSGPESKTIKSPGISNKIITVGGLDDKRENREINLNEVLNNPTKKINNKNINSNLKNINSNKLDNNVLKNQKTNTSKNFSNNFSNKNQFQNLTKLNEKQLQNLTKLNEDEKKLFDVSKFEVAQFSSRGPAFHYFKPDLIAPAVNIVGADYLGDYTKMSGTSVATPMISGICALILSHNSNLTPDQVKVLIIKSCYKISKDYNDDGFGVVDLSKFF